MKKVYSIALCGLVFASCHNNHRQKGEATDNSGKEHNPFAVEFHQEMQQKVDFAVGKPDIGKFGQVIKTAARVQSAAGDDRLIVAKTNGTVLFASENIALGKAVAAGQHLFTIASGGFASGDLSVNYAQAKNNYDKAKADYDRAAELAKSKIVSQKDLQQAKTDYDNASAVYENMQRNFSSAGQSVASAMSGYIKDIAIQAGQYVEAGQAMAIITRNRHLFLTANIPPKYAAALGSIKTANIRAADGKTYSLEEVGGKLVSYGRAAQGDNFLIPVTFQVENSGNFVAGGFVDVFIITHSNADAISIPIAALVEEMGNYFAYVQLAPELFEKREVSIGASDGKNVLITAGITASDSIVVRGAAIVKLAAAAGSVDAEAGHSH